MIAISFLVRSEAILARLRNKKRTGHAPGPLPLVFLRYPPGVFFAKTRAKVGAVRRPYGILGFVAPYLTPETTKGNIRSKVSRGAI